MRKNIVKLLVLMLLLALPALAMADQFAVVKGGRLNLRQGPSAQSASLGKYNTGTWVKVLFAGGQTGFAQVQTLNGKTGYMSENYLNYGAGNNTGTVKYANGGYVNLRSGPALTYAVTMRVTSGTTITVVNDTNEWNYVMVTANGTSVWGYMHDSFIDRGYAGSAVVTTRNGGKVNVRSGPSSAYKSIGSLPSGTKVTVLLKGNDWYQISANGMTGFMSTSYLSGTGSTVGSNTGSSGTVTSTTAWVNNPKNTQVLNLREFASQSARSIGQYRNGTQVKVVSYGNTWCEVYVGTRHGYMMTKYLSFTSQPVYPQNTPVYIYPTVTPTPTPLVQYITPVPQQPQAGPIAGTSGTLAVGAGSGATMINVYRDAALTQLKATYQAGQKMTILQYDASVCMILIGGEVGYVSTWNVNY